VSRSPAGQYGEVKGAGTAASKPPPSPEENNRGRDQGTTDERPVQAGVVRGRPAAALCPPPGIRAGVFRAARSGEWDRVGCGGVRPPPAGLLRQPPGWEAGPATPM